MAYTYETLPWQEYMKYSDANQGTKIQQGSNTDENERKRAWEEYQKRGSSWTSNATPAAVTPSLDLATTNLNPTIVPGAANPANPNQINVADAAGQIAMNPSLLINGQTSLKGQVPTIDPGTAGTAIDPGKYTQTGTITGGTAAQSALTTGTAVTAGDATTAQNVAPKDAQTYEVDKTQDKVAAQDMTAAKGTVNPNALVNAEQIDTAATAAGQTATGQALNAYAYQNIANVVDTTTIAGKRLAEALGEGNYTDAKATMKGQLDILAAEFVGANGEPTIPSWAASSARAVSKIASFSGLSGTAATAAMSQAILEASIPIAQEDAKFFQTVTLTNLNNKQTQTINKANILAQMELANLDARMTAAVENSRAFMQMDLANLNNEQQTRMLNTQNRVQSILEDSKQTNAQRLFTAQSANEMNMFYDNLNSSISQFNASQVNQMKQFNADQINQMTALNVTEANKNSQFNASEMNSMAKFNAELENNRDQFYKSMQFNVDTANAKWRQTVTLQNNQNQFDAAATDVKNMVGISVEQLNQLWDRSDSLLDYIWKSSENEADRASALAIAKFQAQAQQELASMNNKAASKNSTMAGIGSVVGTIAGAWAGSDAGSSAISNLFGFLG